MFRPTRCIIVAVLALSVGWSGIVGDSAAQDKTTKTKTAPSIALPTFEQIVPGKSLLQREVLRGGKRLGVVSDLAFDLETEHAALLIVALAGDAEPQEFVAMPAAVFDFREKQAVAKKEVTDAMVAAARRISTGTTRINRKWAAEEYGTFRRDPYWAEYRDRLKKERPDRKFDEEARQLTLHSQLLVTTIVDEKGRKIGAVADLAIDSQQNIVAYAAYDASGGDAGLRAIPLGAFEAEDGAKQWQVMLPEESVNRFQAFVADSAWPKQIERGWVEYIAVRYGRGGLQSPQPRK